jgi:hypothetical protein
MKSHLGQGKSLFEMRLEFGPNDAVTILAIAEAKHWGEKLKLAQHYRNIIAKDPTHTLTHIFGTETEVSYKTTLERNFGLFSISFHEGIPLNKISENLEGLIGIPGHPTFNKGLNEKPLAIIEPRLKALVEMGIFPAQDAETILTAKRAGDRETLDRFDKKLLDLLTDLDRQGVKAYFNFYKATGVVNNDPRRNNTIVQIKDGRIEMKLIDYQDMHPARSPYSVIEGFDVFENKVKTAGTFTLVESSVRPWVWTFLSDKTGFFECVLESLGEKEGLAVLNEALNEVKTKSYAPGRAALEKFLSSKTGSGTGGNLLGLRSFVLRNTSLTPDTYDRYFTVLFENGLLGLLMFLLTGTLHLSDSANAAAWMLFIALHTTNFFIEPEKFRSKRAWLNLGFASTIGLVSILNHWSPLDPHALGLHFVINFL